MTIGTLGRQPKLSHRDRQSNVGRVFIQLCSRLQPVAGLLLADDLLSQPIQVRRRQRPQRVGKLGSHRAEHIVPIAVFPSVEELTHRKKQVHLLGDRFGGRDPFLLLLEVNVVNHPLLGFGVEFQLILQLLLRFAHHHRDAFHRRRDLFNFVDFQIAGRQTQQFQIIESGILTQRPLAKSRRGRTLELLQVVAFQRDHERLNAACFHDIGATGKAQPAQQQREPAGIQSAVTRGI